MELGIISLIASAVVAGVQVLSFLDERKLKRENKLNVFSKASDVKEGTDTLHNMIESQGNTLQELEKNHAVLEERVENESKNLLKIEHKIDVILEKL